MTKQPRYHWRTLSPAQAADLSASYRSGVPMATLAACYGVSRRTAWRAIQRSTAPTRLVTGDAWQATFELSDDGPVQVTPWIGRSDAA